MDFKEFIVEVFNKAFTLNQAVSLPWVTAIAFITCCIALQNKLWDKTRFMITYVHEIGHALTGVAIGGGLKGIRIHENTSGVTETWRKAGLIGWISSVFTTYIGYPFPGLLALAMIASVQFGFSSLVFLVFTFSSYVILLFMRNLIGFGIALAISITSGLIFWFTPVEVQTIILIAVAGFLIAGGFRSVLELQMNHHRGQVDDSDVHALSHGIVIFDVFLFATYYLLYVGSLIGSGVVIWHIVH